MASWLIDAIQIVQVFAGSKQKQLEVGSMALMAGYTPIATVMLAILVPLFEPIGYRTAAPDTLLGFPYTFQARSSPDILCQICCCIDGRS